MSPYILNIYLPISGFNFSCICFPTAAYIAPLTSVCSFPRFLLSLTHVYLRCRLSATACRQPLVIEIYRICILVPNKGNYGNDTATTRQRDGEKRAFTQQLAPKLVEYKKTSTCQVVYYDVIC